jgi:hypothetical protein
LFLGVTLAPSADPVRSRPPREALQAFNHLIGEWKGTGEPEGSRQEKQRGFWVETQQWEWQFKGDDAWLHVTFDKGKYFLHGDLRYLADGDRYQLTVQTSDKQTLPFVGKLEDKQLTLERVDEAKKEKQRLVVRMLHDNRFVYRYEAGPTSATALKRIYQVGVTKQGEPFASGDGKPECIVSGGLGTMPVSYKGQTFYVCCTGCRDEFLDNPEKYIAEYKAKKSQKPK